MEYEKIVEIYERIESTTKRLEMTDYLVELLKGVPPRIIDKVVYLTQGILFPDFVGIELGLAEKLVIRALSFTTGLKDSEVEKMWLEKGDMGLVASEALGKKMQKVLFTHPLTIERVYNNLREIAMATGSGSQEVKMKLLADLLHDASPREGKYIIRTVIGKMRLGVADMTIVDALALAFAEKERRDEIERAYNVCSDLGRVAKVLTEKGMEGLKEIRLEIGIPVRAMLCERLSSLEEIFEKLGKCAFEYKYDGLRIQAHIKQKEVKLFSRRLEDISEQFPELAEGLRQCFQGKEGIVEGEAVPIDPNTGAFLPFQEVSHRRGRKYDLEAMAEEYPVHFLLFDCLCLDGKDLTMEPLLTRRGKLEKAIKPNDRISFSEIKVTEELAEAERFFEKAIGDGCEGLIAKSISSPYQAGARGWLWIKYKREYKSEMSDTADLVVVGAFAGRGKRAGTYGALLMGAYDDKEDMFTTICKLGSGFDDETLFSLPETLKPYRLEEQHPKVKSNLEADYWFEPKVVLEVRGAEITLSPIHTSAFGRIKEGTGLAIRFPRFTGRWREDKRAEDATSVSQLIDMYKRQLKKTA